MSFEEFQQAIRSGTPAAPDLGAALTALFLDARGDWDGAHAAAQADPGADGAWVHAFLHRKEGDRSNAGYWYRRAGRPVPEPAASLETEWEEIARTLLAARNR
jgi:hypothetical protein